MKEKCFNTELIDIIQQLGCSDCYMLGFITNKKPENNYLEMVYCIDYRYNNHFRTIPSEEKNIHICDMLDVTVERVVSRKKLVYPISFERDLSVYNIIRKQGSVPELLNYDNSTKEGENFIISFTHNNKDINMSFDKNLNVVLDRENAHCKVFNINKDNNPCFEEKSEEYYFTYNGYFCANYSDKIYTYIANDTIIEYKLLINRDKIKGTDGSFIRNLATLIEYNGERKFVLNYDNFGLVSTCVEVNKSEINLCKYSSRDTDNKKEIYSLHPLLFDKFHYNYNSEDPLKYWALDLIVNTGESSEYPVDLCRLVFEVRKDKLDELIKYINK